MSRRKQKCQKLKLTRAERKAELERVEFLAGLKKGTIIAVDKSKVFSRSVVPEIPNYYRDKWFTCKDCGEKELWTAKQQQRWYEEQGGEIEAIAIRCRACRRKESSDERPPGRFILRGLRGNEMRGAKVSNP